MVDNVDDPIFGPDAIEFTVTEPYWQIPISKLLLAHLGRITLMWAGIDDTLDKLLCTVHGISWRQLNAFVGGKLVSSKVAMLDAGLYRVADDDQRQRAKTLCEMLHKVAPRRNIAFHGSWGHHISDDGKHFRPGAISSRRPGTKFYAEDLLDLHEEVAEIDHHIHRLYNDMTGSPAPAHGTSPRKFFSSKEFVDQLMSSQPETDTP